jgi:hypothetical protein
VRHDADHIHWHNRHDRNNNNNHRSRHIQNLYSNKHIYLILIISDTTHVFPYTMYIKADMLVLMRDPLCSCQTCAYVYYIIFIWITNARRMLGVWLSTNIQLNHMCESLRWVVNFVDRTTLVTTSMAMAITTLS